jgi:TrpR-related protein YerC/YecD
MTNSTENLWQSAPTSTLARTLASMSDEETMRNFLRDVMTEKEIIEISARFEAARLLSMGEKYESISKQTKLSSRTIARISDWLKNGSRGYAEALKIASTHHEHIPPARD